MNWHYPATKYNNKAAWYTVVRRTVFFVPTWIAIFLMLTFIYLGWGKDTAMDIWRNVV